MGLLKSASGPSQQEVWSQLAEELGGEYKKGESWENGVLSYKHQNWLLMLDTYTDRGSSNNSIKITYTRLRAPFVSTDGFRFSIYPASIFSPIGKLLGMQDIEVDDATFDKTFIIKGNDEALVKALLANKELKSLIDDMPGGALEVIDDESFFFGKFAPNVDELYYETTGVIKDPDQLRSLFKLFTLTLQLLCDHGAATDAEPETDQDS